MHADYRLSAAELPRDLRAIAEIISRTFAGGGYVEEILQEYVGNCNYDPRATRLVWDGDRLAHHWGVWGYDMRLEGTTLRVAGIGAVATDEAYRKQGLMQRAARASFQAMLEQGYDLSILRGRHYVKYGYARAWNYVTYRLGASLGSQIPNAPPPPYRALVLSELDAISRLYNQAHAGLNGTAVRPTYRSLKSDAAAYQGWFAADGSLSGYVRAMPAAAAEVGGPEDADDLVCLEAAGDAQECLAVLGDLFRRGQPPETPEAAAKPYRSLAFFTLPHLHPVLQQVRRSACLVQTQYFANTGWRVRLVNLRGALEKLRPLLEQRLRHSHLSGWRGALLLEAGELCPAVRLEIDRCQVSLGEPGECPNVIAGGAALARLLIGSDEPDEVVRQEGIECRGAAAELAGVLFPNLHPMLSHWDEF